jgi:hypothetical protein
MKLVHEHRRLFVLGIAIALLGGLAAWRLSATAQAHRGRAAEKRSSTRREPLDRRRAREASRVQPGGPLLERACFLVRGGFDGSHVLLVPLDSPRPALRDCTAHPCIELPAGRARAVQIFGGGYRDALPALPRRPLARCGLRLPPGYAVPLGR